MITNGAIIFARFICASVLHMSLMEEVNSSLMNMKYALNHGYMFQRDGLAFIVCFMHFAATTSTEFCNIAIILTSQEPVDIVLNFIAIAIIAEFDNFVYSSMRNEYFKKLIENSIAEKVLIVHHTTSKRCGADDLSDVKDDNGDYRKLKISLMDRDCRSKIKFFIYKTCRWFFVSFYFYFLPFFVVILSCMIPTIYQSTN